MPTLTSRQLSFLAGADNTVRRLEQPHRFEKDILRSGKWTVDGESWEVTPATLAQIVRNFNLGKERGLDCPVVWNHSQDVRDRTGIVEKLFIRGETLVGQFSLSNPDTESQVINSGGVSVEIREPFIDGLGNEYDLMLTHLGIVSHPVIPNQGPFKRLSLLAGTQTMPKPRYAVRQLANGKSWIRQLADGEAVAPDEKETTTPPKKEPNAPDAAAESYPEVPEEAAGPLVVLFNRCLARAEPPLQLPEGTNGTNLIERATIVDSMYDQIDGMDGDDESGEGMSDNQYSVPDVPPEVIAPQYAQQLSLKLKTNNLTDADRAVLKLAAEVKGLKAAEEKTRQLALQQAEFDFRAKLEELCGTTQVLIKQKEDLLEAGKAVSWKLSILKPYESLEPQLNTKSKTRKLAALPSEPGREPTKRTFAEARQFGLSMIGGSQAKKKEN